MKGLKKFVCFAVCTALMLQFTGCSVGSDVSYGDEAYKSMWLSDKPVELTVFYPASKDSDGQWRIFKEAAKMTNVSAMVTMSRSNTDFNQSFNLMVASGKMTDIVETYDPVGFSKLGTEGAFVPLNEYFETHAPNFSKFLDENPDVRKRITAFDGNIYFMPHVPGGNASEGWFVRKDWLDKLGLEVPTNVDELYNVLTAFKNQDPNGNGQADEVPYFSNKNLSALFGLWGARTEIYIDGDTVKYGPAQPEYKTALENIIKWYNEGLMDKEIITRSNDGRDMFLSENLGGVTHNWFGSTARYNDRLKEEIEGFSFIPFAPPTGVELSSRPASSEYGWGVSASSENVEAAVKWLDFWYSEEGLRLMNFGVEGTHYDMVDGKPQFKAELLAQDDVQKQLTEFGIQMDIGFRQDFEYEKQWINDIAISGMEMYENGGYIAELVPPLSMWMDAADIEKNTTLQTQVETYSDEMMQKWLLGAEVFDSAAWEKYLAALEKMGLSEFVNYQQKAYDVYKK